MVVYGLISVYTHKENQSSYNLDQSLKKNCGQDFQRLWKEKSIWNYTFCNEIMKINSIMTVALCFAI